mmetsp:Transcript_26661/g.66999  ORF Transcript_26661/g.66999 Transcript_26661/m.66999 type:complete len:325 (+) Transcript_26661:65-1039(+)
MAMSLQDWLQARRLGKYFPVLSQQGYSTVGSLLACLSEEQLERIGVTLRGHRRKLWFHIVEEKAAASPNYIEEFSQVDRTRGYQQRIGDVRATNSPELDISNQQLLEIPDIGDLQSLRRVDASMNSFQVIPKSFCYLRSLTTLRLCENQLEVLPDEFGELKSLQVLDLGTNCFQDLPLCVCSLSNLRVLLINSNAIADIPPEISRLCMLESLSFSYNYIEECCEELCLLWRLKLLQLDSNQLIRLPTQLGRLTCLEELDISDNQITHLPASAAAIPQLVVNVTNSPLAQKIGQASFESTPPDHKRVHQLLQYPDLLEPDMPASH